MPYKRAYKSTAKGRRSRGSAMSRYKKKPDSFSKTKVKAVKKIVNKVINKNAESKYFNSTNMNDLVRIEPLQSRNGLTSIAAVGFAVGTGESAQMSTITYGYQGGVGNINVYDLNMARLFGQQDPEAPVDVLKQNALEGSYANPSMCKTEWLVQVPQQDTTLESNYGTPMFCRILRVKPRKQKYADLSINPKNDLFVNQFGIEIGISSSSFNDQQLHMFKVNTRKYELIEDIQKTLVPASTTATLAIADGNTITTDLVKSGSNCRLVMQHKQPKRLFYIDAAVDGSQPQDGQSNELILFHFTKLGTSGNYSSNEKNVEITCKPVSTFKDF